MLENLPNVTIHLTDASKEEFKVFLNRIESIEATIEASMNALGGLIL